MTISKAEAAENFSHKALDAIQIFNVVKVKLYSILFLRIMHIQSKSTESKRTLFKGYNLDIFTECHKKNLKNRARLPKTANHKTRTEYNTL